MIQPRELDIHAGIANLFRAALPHDAVWHHSPNELDMSGKLAARAVAKAKWMGMRPGWPDFEIMWRGSAYFIEVKTPKGRVTDQQRAAMEALRAAGCLVEVVRSVDDAVALLKGWGMMP